MHATRAAHCSSSYAIKCWRVAHIRALYIQSQDICFVKFIEVHKLPINNYQVILTQLSFQTNKDHLKKFGV